MAKIDYLVSKEVQFEDAEFQTRFSFERSYKDNCSIESGSSHGSLDRLAQAIVDDYNLNNNGQDLNIYNDPSLPAIHGGTGVIKIERGVTSDSGCYTPLTQTEFVTLYKSVIRLLDNK